MSGTAATSASPSPPVLLTSLTSAALLDGRGDLELNRESRGTVFDWGGVYGQLVRLTGPWKIFLSTGSEATSLKDCRTGAESTPGGWRSLHRWGRFTVTQDVAAVDPPSGVLRSLSVSVDDGPPSSLLVVSEFSPFLLPVLVEGILPTTFHVETSPEALSVRQRGFGLEYRSSVLPSHLYLNRASWLGGRYVGRVDAVVTDHELTVAPGRPATVTFLVSGGLERSLGSASVGNGVVRDPAAAIGRVAAADRDWLGRTPTLRFPDEPSLERAYGRARAALRRLYSAPGDGLTGLVAGYPWYSAIWCRDLAWMLPAVLWLGDFDWVARSLASVFEYQARANVPILGGEPGELPMQVSPGPIFLYGTSDTTLYYPDIVARYVRHSGDRAAAYGWAAVVERVLGWGRSRTDPASGLVRNGGEAEAIESATGGLANVRYGIDSPDTTIWDSADRRDHAIDVQLLWRGALLAAADLSEGPASDPRRIELVASAERVTRSVRDRYRWPEEGYLADSVRGGNPVKQLRPNALRAVPAGVLDASSARSVVLRAARPDLTTAWGVRTVSSEDPNYDPQSYHMGQVWTIATAWAAEAALAAGERELGVGYLRTIAERYEAEGGWANECYRGDRAEPFDSCFLLGFSIAPFLSILFERLWGLSVDARVPRLEVRPAFAAGWTTASLESLRVGVGSASLDWTPDRLRVDWRGTVPLDVRTRLGTTRVAPQSRAEISGNISSP